VLLEIAVGIGIDGFCSGLFAGFDSDFDGCQNGYARPRPPETRILFLCELRERLSPDP